MTDSFAIVIVSGRTDQLAEFIETLQKDGDVTLRLATSCDDAVRMSTDLQPALMVVDEHVGEVPGLDLVRRLVEVNPFVNTAVLSALNDEDFHHRSEGLGLLAGLPVRPGPEDARRLIRRLGQLMPADPSK